MACLTQKTCTKPTATKPTVSNDPLAAMDAILSTMLGVVGNAPTSVKTPWAFVGSAILSGIKGVAGAKTTQGSWTQYNLQKTSIAAASWTVCELENYIGGIYYKIMSQLTVKSFNAAMQALQLSFKQTCHDRTCLNSIGTAPSTRNSLQGQCCGLDHSNDLTCVAANKTKPTEVAQGKVTCTLQATQGDGVCDPSGACYQCIGLSDQFNAVTTIIEKYQSGANTAAGNALNSYTGPDKMVYFTQASLFILALYQEAVMLELPPSVSPATAAAAAAIYVGWNSKLKVFAADVHTKIECWIQNFLDPKRLTPIVDKLSVYLPVKPTCTFSPCRLFDAGCYRGQCNCNPIDGNYVVRGACDTSLNFEVYNCAGKPPSFGPCTSANGCVCHSNPQPLPPAIYPSPGSKKGCGLIFQPACTVNNCPDHQLLAGRWPKWDTYWNAPYLLPAFNAAKATAVTKLQNKLRADIQTIQDISTKFYNISLYGLAPNMWGIYHQKNVQYPIPTTC